MHSPLNMQDAAHFRDASEPSPVRTRSSTPLMMSSGLASEMPAGLTLGQTSTHLPQRVQASTMSSTRPASADSNEKSYIKRALCPDGKSCSVSHGNAAARIAPIWRAALRQHYLQNRTPLPLGAARRGVWAPLSVIGDAAIEGSVLCAKAPPQARTPAP